MMPLESAESSVARNINILIIEDDSFISTSFADKLTKLGFTPFAATTTQEAQQILDARPIHFILLDILLPHEDGLAFLKKLKKEDAYRSIPVMVLSNLVDQETVAYARGLGAVDYVVKAEQTPTQIAQKIMQHLQQNP